MGTKEIKETNRRFDPSKIINDTYQKQIFRNECNFISEICKLCNEDTWVDENTETTDSNMFYRIKHFALPEYNLHVYLRTKSQDHYKNVPLSNNTNLIISSVPIPNLTSDFFSIDTATKIQDMGCSYILFNKNNLSYTDNDDIRISYLLGTDNANVSYSSIYTNSTSSFEKLVACPEDDLPECSIDSDMFADKQHFDYELDDFKKLSLFYLMLNRLNNDVSLTKEQKDSFFLSFNDIAKIFKAFGRDDISVFSDSAIALQKVLQDNTKLQNENNMLQSQIENLHNEIRISTGSKKQLCSIIEESDTKIADLLAKNADLLAKLATVTEQLEKSQKGYTEFRNFIVNTCKKVPFFGKYLLKKMAEMQQSLPDGQKGSEK